MRVFISHSSKDKKRFCDSVANKLIEKLGKNSIVYDELTFEAGEKSIDEINRTLDYSDLYVIFLSQSAVESDWVKYELSKAKEKLSEHTLDRIYPLIIDESLNYADSRIPGWLKDYNLKPIMNPAKAARLIVERAKDINWTRHPHTREKSIIFVGRNDLVNSFETRIDDFEKPTVNTFAVSGLPNIGRKSLARHCLIKGTIKTAQYDFPQISLSYQESIEDFIYKLHDLGLTEEYDLPNLVSKTLSEKTSIAISISKEISALSEIILIKDDGCIIDYRGNIVEWFKDIVSSSDLSTQLLYIIITKYKSNFESFRTAPSVFTLNVPELSQSERNGLLRRLAYAEKLNLTRSNLEEIGEHLTGYPAQVYYAVDVIKSQGFSYLKRNYKLLSDYNEQEVSSLLEKYKDNNSILEILALISKYDAISFSMLYNILEVTPGYTEIFQSLFQESFFELEGINGEYVRLNEVIRNYVARAGIKVLGIHRRRAQFLFEELFKNDTTSWYGANDLLMAVRETVKQGKIISSEYMIPSIYLKSMSDLYADMKYEDVVGLARRALEHTENIDSRILRETRYLLCAALAKLKSKEFLEEVNKLDYDDKTFLLAFYYRQIGKADRALTRLDELLTRRPGMSKAKREKVLVLKNLQQFEEATALAKENYYLFSDNPYHIQAYFDCLINTYSKHPEDSLLYELLIKLERIQSEKAQSMYMRCNALYLAFVEEDYDAALNEIEEAVFQYPRDKKYALVVKFDIAQRFNDEEAMDSTIAQLEEEGANTNSVVICRAKLLATQGKQTEAVAYFLKNISFFTEDSKKSFCEKLMAYRN